MVIFYIGMFILIIICVICTLKLRSCYLDVKNNPNKYNGYWDKASYLQLLKGNKKAYYFTAIMTVIVIIINLINYWIQSYG